MAIVDKILKIFVGDKFKKDQKLIQPIVDKVLKAEKSVETLSVDELREKTLSFKKKIKDSYAQEQKEIEELRLKASTEKDIDAKDAIFNQIDEIENKIIEISEKVLEELLPEAFAVVKETAKRFANNETLEVRANESDIVFAGTKDYVTVSNDTAVWKNNWDAAGKEVIWDMIHYDVQLFGGAVLHQGKIAEMQTGEGKTLVATLPLYLNALTGRGVHVVTVNEYLAKRDAAWNAPIFEFHGLTVDCIDLHKPNSEGRKKAYLADITYGTNNEFGFDYLRDNMADSNEKLVQRKLNYAIVDEVDSVLIDDARTPLIISGPVPQGDKQEFDELKPRIEKLVSNQRSLLANELRDAKKLIDSGESKDGGEKLFRVFRGLPKNKPLIKFLSQDGMRTLLQKTENFFLQDNKREMPTIENELYFTIEEKTNTVDLTDKGLDFLSGSDSDKDFFILPDLSTEIAKIQAKGLSEDEEGKEIDDLYRDFSIKSERIHTLNQLLKAYCMFEKDVDYIIQENKVKIVDEQTGRVMEGRRYSDGLHQALEAKENVKIEASSQTYATVTLQNYFRMYNKLSGMTGTAETEAGEFWEIYELDVVVIPTNRPIARLDKNDLVYKTTREKYNAVIEEITRISKEENRPILVGTTSVEISELLSRALNLRKISHNVLNAKRHQAEAQVVADAGKPGNVTIATNMAGRGTDIKLSEEVKAAGGLAIIGTERHDSRRVDRQLRGRSGRQGDPGSSQFFVSLDDKLMRIFGSERIAKTMDRMGHTEGEVIQHGLITKSIERAQKKVEENAFGVRKRLLEYDDVMNAQREVIYKRRRNALDGRRLAVDVSNMIYDVVSVMVSFYKSNSDFEGFNLEFIKTFAHQLPIGEEEFKNASVQELTQQLNTELEKAYADKKERNATIIHSVVKAQKNDGYTNVVLPFSDGQMGVQVYTNIEKLIETQGQEAVLNFEKAVTLSKIDDIWKTHLREMDELKDATRNAVYEQKDPLLIYKFEAFELFQVMLDNLNKDILSFLFKGELPFANQESVQGTNQSRAEKRKVALQAGRAAEESSTSNEAVIANDAARQPAEPVAPRKVEKIGRNEKVTIKHAGTGEEKELKYKQAIPLLESGLWHLMK